MYIPYQLNLLSLSTVYEDLLCFNHMIYKYLGGCHYKLAMAFYDSSNIHLTIHSTLRTTTVETTAHTFNLFIVFTVDIVKS